MKIDVIEFLAHSRKNVNLKHWPTRVKPFYDSEKNYHKLLEHHIEELSTMQGQLYADGRHALLIIFQAMDAGGKDSAIKHVMSGVNPQGCQVSSFKSPSAQELAHDFLWRTTGRLPERGTIGIFNRSYYESVLVVRVHAEILAKEKLPEELAGKKNFWEHRLQSIADFEKHLHRNGTHILKFFLHISKAEQKRRFLKRIDEPEKNWKFSADDMRDRRLWKDYMKAYESCLGATSTAESPWLIVPADDKPNARLIISQAIIDAVKKLRLASLQPTKEERNELKKMRKALEAD
ncbi:MAG: ADP-polyphosphate phosphotransferase [Limisphaerales bacterium]